ncbi:hypothetical protein PG984_016666 [Apiospora sp. TS-2023a]
MFGALTIILSVRTVALLSYSGESLGREVWYPREILEDHRYASDDEWQRPSAEKEAQNWFCLCTAPYPLSLRHQAIWTKLRILCYDLNGWDRTLFGNHDEQGAGLLVPNAAGPNPVATPEEYMRWWHLEAADLEKMAMTS